MQKKRLIQLIHIARNELGMDGRHLPPDVTGADRVKPQPKEWITTQLNCVLESMKKKGFRVKTSQKSQLRFTAG